ncbi:MAG: hypothetical protein ACRCWS_04730 [Propionibacteriaceae bacterium]
MNTAKTAEQIAEACTTSDLGTPVGLAQVCVRLRLLGRMLVWDDANARFATPGTHRNPAYMHEKGAGCIKQPAPFCQELMS